MSKKKSLGSSPIGLKSERTNSSMGFIPDLGVADTKKETTLTKKETPVAKKKKEKSDEQSVSKRNNKEKQKKVVSYNLETELINKIKSIAREKDMYYSSFVSMVIKNWIARNS